MNGVRIYVSNDINNKDIILNGEPLDLFDDENINITLKQSDFKEISTNFADYTQVFTVPSSPTNNKIFKYWYDIYNDNQLPSVEGIPARIDIDGILFKMGTIKIQKFGTDDNGRPKQYSVNFTSNIKSLKDQFGDTLISGLSFSSIMSGNHNFLYQDFNIRNMITNNDNSAVEMPIISVRRLLDNYDTLEYTSTNSQGIRKEELRPAVKFKTILTAIEEAYKLKFIGDFYNINSPLDKLYLWANKNEEPTSGTGQILDYNGVQNTTTDFILSGVDSSNYVAGTNSVWINPTTDIITFSREYRSDFNWRSQPVQIRLDSVKLTTTNTTAQYKLFIQEVILNSSGHVDEMLTNSQDNSGFVFSSEYFTGTNQININLTWNTLNEPNGKKKHYRLKVESKGTITFTKCDITVTETDFITKWGVGSGVTGGVTGGIRRHKHILLSTAHNTIQVYFNTVKSLPDLTIYDFITSLIKMYNLVIVPQFNPYYQELYPNRKVFLLETFNKYYGGINEIDITKYVDLKRNISKVKTFKKIEFKHSDSSYGTNILFKNTQFPTTREFGSIKSEFSNGDEGEFKIETKFNLLIWREMQNTDVTELNKTWLTADSLNEDFSKPVFNKPTIFYYNGKASLSNLSLSFVNDVNTINALTTYSQFSNIDDLINENANTITFSSEREFNSIRDNSLFKRFYAKLINGIYSPYSREYEVNAILPKQVYRDLSLGSQLIISQDRFTITEININLLNGETKLKLNNIVEEGNILETTLDLAAIPPSIFTGTPYSNIVDLSWSGTFDTYGIEGYNIEYSVNDSAYLYLDTVYTTSFSGTYSHIGVTAGATYSYRLNVLDIAGNLSDYVYTVVTTSDSIPPTAPINFIFSTHPDSIYIFWSGATDNIGIQGYELQYKPTSSATWSSPQFFTSSLSSHATLVDDLNLSTLYDFRVRTKDTYDNWSITYKTGSASTTNPYRYLRSIDSKFIFDPDFCDVALPTEPIYSNKMLYEIGIGDKFYTDASLTIPFDGNQECWRISEDTISSPFIVDSYKINDDGSLMGIYNGCPAYTFEYYKSSNSYPYDYGDISPGEGFEEFPKFTLEDGCYLSSSGVKLWTRIPIEFFNLTTDKIYTNEAATTVFNGGGRIWKVNTITTTWVIVVDRYGYVSERYQCS